TACAHQDQFHRARGQVVAAAGGIAIHGHDMPAARSGHEQHAFRALPVDGAFHDARFLEWVWLRAIAAGWRGPSCPCPAWGNSGLNSATRFIINQISDYNTVFA